MEGNRGRDNEALARDEAAADWLQRLDDPQLAEEDMQAWLQWFGASDANRRAFEELQILRRRFRELSDSDRKELKRRTTADFPGRRPGAHELLARFRLPAAAGVCALIIGLGVWWNAYTHVSSATFAAPADHHRAVTLGDGSSVVLGSDAMVDVAYSARLRSVTIQRGQAYFEVKHDSERPFVVHAADIRVTALGTAFNVRRETDTVSVTVTQGRVAVSSAARGAPPAQAPERLSPGVSRKKEMMLSVGQVAVLPLAESGFRARQVASPATPGWNDGRADFIDTPLSEVLPVINRYAPRKLLIDDPRVADLTYSGTILRDHVDEWIASLPQVYAVRTVMLEDGSVTLVSRPTTAAR